MRAHLVSLMAHQERVRTGEESERWEPNSESLEMLSALLPRIVGFEISVSRAQAKAKLGQNFAADTVDSTSRALAAAGGVEELQVAKLMENLAESESSS